MLLSARIEKAVMILPFPSTMVLLAVFLGSFKASLSSTKESSVCLLSFSNLFLGRSGFTRFNCGVVLPGLVRLLSSTGTTSPRRNFRVGPQAATAARLASMFDSGVRTL